QQSGLFTPGPDIVRHLVQSGLDRRRIDQIGGEGGLRAARLALAIRIDRAMILSPGHTMVPGAGLAEMMLKKGQGLASEVRARLDAQAVHLLSRHRPDAVETLH